MKADLEHIEESLGIELPASYRDFLRRMSEIRSWEKELIRFDAEQVVELNEQMFVAENIAGLEEWPAEYFVFADDGCGNYYALDLDDEDSPVLFYDHEADEIQEIADSLQEFVDRLLQGGGFSERAVHSGYAARQSRASSGTWKATEFRFEPGDPAWMTDWSAWVSTFLEIVLLDQSDAQRTQALNTAFGSKPVQWIGTVGELDLGESKRVRIKMPVYEGVDDWGAFSKPIVIHAGLRTEEDKYNHVETLSPQIVTTVDAWKAVSIGDTIRFQMMFAPGREDSIACVKYELLDRPVAMIQDCGAHVVEILRKSDV